MEQIKIPDGYQSSLNLHDTQIAIKTVKDFFQQTLAQKLNLLRVSAPAKKMRSMYFSPPEIRHSLL